MEKDFPRKIRKNKGFDFGTEIGKRREKAERRDSLPLKQKLNLSAIKNQNRKLVLFSQFRNNIRIGEVVVSGSYETRRQNDKHPSLGRDRILRHGKFS